MIITNIIMCVLLYYQITMPAVDNAKYAVTVRNGEVIRMNTQNGKFEKCDDNLNCKAVE